MSSICIPAQPLKRLTAVLIPLLAFSSLFAFTLQPQTVNAASLIVTQSLNTNDGTCNTLCTLRDALASASNGDTIVISNILANQTMQLGGTQLSIDKSVTISSSVPFEIDAQSLSRAIEVGAGVTVTLDGLTISNGSTLVIDCDAQTTRCGGGIKNAGTLTLRNSTLRSSQAEHGGGIYSSGSLSITHSTLRDNTAVDDGGGLHIADGSLTLFNSTISGNAANRGGGIYSDQVFNVAHSTIAHNTASLGAGVYARDDALFDHTLIANPSSGQDCLGLVTSLGHNLEQGNSCFFYSTGDLFGIDPQLVPLADNGGRSETHALLPTSVAVDAGNASCGNPSDQRGAGRQGAACDIGAYELTSHVVSTLVDELDSDFSDGDLSLREAISLAQGSDATVTFKPSLSGGTISLGGTQLTLDDDVVIKAHVPISVSGSSQSRVFYVSSGVNAVIEGLTIRDGAVPNTDCDGANNRCGGGLLIDTNAQVLLQYSVVHDNSAELGGGIHNKGKLTIIDSTIRDNSADAESGGINNLPGAHLTIYGSTLSGNNAGTFGGSIGNVGTLTLTRSTISGNGAQFGGGFFNTGTATLIHVTVSKNFGATHGSNFFNTNQLFLQNSLIAMHLNLSCTNTGTVTLYGNNISDDNSCLGTGAGTMTHAALSLGPLADNGGRTQTHALPIGSPAIDSVSGSCFFYSIDQRGFFSEGNCDIGAFEYQTPFGRVTISDVTASEGTTATLTIAIDEPRNSLIEMFVESSNGSAINGSDYVWFTAIGVIKAGEVTTTIQVPILDDAEVEGQEKFDMTISFIFLTHQAAIVDGSARVTITENDQDESNSSVTITPSVGAMLTFSQTENGVTTPVSTIEIPAGSVSETVTLMYTEISTSTTDSGFIFAGNRFEITAFTDGVSHEHYTFTAPVTVTIHYSDTLLMLGDEANLRLQFWTGSDWIDAAATCYGDDPNLVPNDAYVRDEVNNTLSVQICHLTEFALFMESSPTTVGMDEISAETHPTTQLALTAAVLSCLTLITFKRRSQMWRR